MKTKKLFRVFIGSIFVLTLSSHVKVYAEGEGPGAVGSVGSDGGFGLGAADSNSVGDGGSGDSGSPDDEVPEQVAVFAVTVSPPNAPPQQTAMLMDDRKDKGSYGPTNQQIENMQQGYLDTLGKTGLTPSQVQDLDEKIDIVVEPSGIMSVTPQPGVTQAQMDQAMAALAQAAKDNGFGTVALSGPVDTSSAPASSAGSSPAAPAQAPATAVSNPSKGKTGEQMVQDMKDALANGITGGSRCDCTARR